MESHTSASRGFDRLEAWYKSTEKSTKFFVIIRFVDPSDCDNTAILPEIHADLLCSFAHLYRVDDDAVQEALLNMRFGVASDPTCPRKNKPLRVKVPTSSSTYVDHEVKRCYTSITIPFKTLASMPDESAWIEGTLQRVLNGIRVVLASRPYRNLLEGTAGMSGNGEYAKRLYHPRAVPNFPKFLRKAIVTIGNAELLTEYLIEAECDHIAALLEKAELPTKKYK